MRMGVRMGVCEKQGWSMLLQTMRGSRLTWETALLPALCCPQEEEVACRYRLEVQTSDARKAGTSDSVFVTLIGTACAIGECGVAGLGRAGPMEQRQGAKAAVNMSFAKHALGACCLPAPAHPSRPLPAQ